MFTARALTLGDKLVECRSLQNGLSSPRYQLFHCSGSHLGRANSYRPWTTSEHDRYDELIQQGWTRRRIATALDRSPGSIKYHSEKPQVPPKSSWRHWSQAEDERLLQADGAGKRLMQIVEMFPDRTRWAVQARRTMLKSGPSDATPSRSGCVPAAWNHEEDILLLRLYEEKLSPKAIAARLNKEPHQVRSRIALIRTAAPIKKNKRWSEQDHHKLLSLKAEGVYLCHEILVLPSIRSDAIRYENVNNGGFRCIKRLHGQICRYQALLFSE